MSMYRTVAHQLRTLRFGEPQHLLNLTVLPVFGPEGTLHYQTLSEAMALSGVLVSEVSNSGSVPELLVVNRGEVPLLLLDGEELSGAKQNRVLNTSILLREKSETRIPVSCTEQGRWNYTSATFKESGNVMSPSSRARKSHSVSNSLKGSGLYQSDQGEVWSGIAELQHMAGLKSPTSAMNDVFRAREEELQRCGRQIPCLPGQIGLLVFGGGKPVGLEWVSSASAYARIHPKLVRSYSLEALLVSSGAPVPSVDASAKALEFVESLTIAEEQPFPSVGYGTDRRYQGAGITGFALEHQEEVIHAVFFGADASAPTSGPMSESRARRFRMFGW